MARQEHTPTVLDGPYGSYAADGVDLTYLTADPSNLEQVKLRRGEMIVAKNAGASAVNVTVTSVDDPFGRQEDIVYSVGAGEDAIIGPFHPNGWQQSDGYLYFEAATTDVSFAVVRVPNY